MKLEILVLFCIGRCYEYCEWCFLALCILLFCFEIGRERFLIFYRFLCVCVVYVRCDIIGKC